MDQIKVYKVPAKVKVSMAVIMLVVTFLIIFIFALIGSRVPLIVPVAFGVFFFLASITTVTLTATEVVVKSMIGRKKRYAYADGEFETRELSGMAAFVATGKGTAKMIFFQKKGAKRLVLAVNGYFPKEDVDQMFAEIEARKAKP